MSPVADTVIGREEELGKIAAFLDASAEPPSALLLEGDAGIGKTTLWRYGIAAAAEREYRVLSCSPAEAEATLAYAAVGDLLEHALPEAEAELAPPQRRALRVALLLEAAEGVPPMPRAIAVAVLNVLRALSRASPVLVAVDDLQWTDSASASVLSFVARRLRGEPVCFLLSQRPATANFDVPAERLLRLELGPLSLGALRRVLEDRIATGYARPMLRRIHEASGGNPFYALELARMLGPDVEPRSDQALPVPARLRELIQARLRALPPETVEAVRLAAALAQPSLELLEAAVGADITPRLEPAVVAGVLELERGHVRFAHPLFPESIRAALAPREERALHRRLAEVVVDREERARHLGLAAEGAEETIAATLEQAARAASLRGAPAAAADLAEEALRLTPSRSTNLHRRTFAAAEYHRVGGNTARACRLLDVLVSQESPGPGRAMVLDRLARIVDDPRTSIPLLEQGLREAEGDLALMVMIEQALAGQAWLTWTDLPRAARHLRRALELAENLPDRAVLAQVLASVADIESFLGRGFDRALIERAVALSEGDDQVPLSQHPRWMWARILGRVGEFAHAGLLLADLCREAADRGDEHALAMFLNEVGWGAWRTGDSVAALEHAERALELARDAELAAIRAFALSLRAWLYAQLGYVEETRTAAAETLAFASMIGARLPEMNARHALGVLALSLDDAAEARRQLDSLAERAWSAGIREPRILRTIPDEVASLVAVGEAEMAANLLGRFEREARRLDRVWAVAAAARCRGLLAAAEGDLERAERAFEEALRQHDRLREPFELARTLLAYGAAQRRAKRRGDARLSLERALAIFEELGARLWAERTRAELARIGGRAPSSGDLTVTERRLAELVAEGLSNKEIAAALFVTPKTVGTKLSRIYAKLGARSRTELVHHLAERRASKV
jgi:DNA-binding CsgD family transcriptional regulator